MIPVIFHNLKGYDSHLIMKYITRDYAPSSIDVTPTSSEKLVIFQFGNLRILDNLQCLAASLDTLFESLAADGKDKFNHIIKHYPDSDLVSERGITGMNTRMKETSINPAVSHRHFLQFSNRRIYHSRSVRTDSERVARILHKKHATIPRPSPKPRRLSASRCF